MTSLAWGSWRLSFLVVAGLCSSWAHAKDIPEGDAGRAAKVALDASNRGTAPEVDGRPRLASSRETKLELIRGYEGVSETGFVAIAGEVKNTSSDWVEFVRVDIQLLDDAGKPIYVTGVSEGLKKDMGGTGDEPETTYALVHRLAPGASAPFTYLRDTRKLARPFKSASLAALGTKSAAGATVSVRGFTWRADGGFYNDIKGEVVVDTGECYSAQVALVERGKDGKVRSVTTQHIDATFQKVLGAKKSSVFSRKVLTKSADKLEAYAFCGTKD